MKRPTRSSHCLITPHQWRELPCGVHYQKSLQEQLNLWWPKIMGPHLLKLGELSIDLSSERCMAAHQVSFPLSGNQPERPLCIESQQLSLNNIPFSNNWFDACLLAHTLDYVANPHDILREVDRILTNQGWLLISGFNSLSLLGIGKSLPVMRHQQPYNSPLVSCRRVVHWLCLLNYQVLSQQTFQVLPWRGCGRVAGLPDEWLSLFGCQYLIVARKLTIPLQPLQPRIHYLPLWNKPLGACSNTLIRHPNIRDYAQ